MKALKLFAMLLAFLLLVACQPTPEQDFVAQKNTNAMLEKAAAHAAPLTVPETYTASFQSSSGRLFVEADAQVAAPQTSMPILRVRPTGFDRETIARIADVLFGEDAYYVADRVNRSKGSILRQAEALQADLEDWNANAYKYFEVYDTKESAQAGLEQMMHDAALAPDPPPRAVPNYAELPLSGSNVSASDVYIMLNAMPDEATYSFMTVWSMPESHYVFLNYLRDDVIGVDLTWEPVDITEYGILAQDAAIAICDEAVKQMRLDAYTLSCCFSHLTHQRTIPVYELYYTFTQEGAHMTYAYADGIGESYSAPWEQGYLQFIVDEQGILAFAYKNPFTVEKTEVESCALLPFSEIVSIFEKIVVLVQNQIDYNERFPEMTETLHITDVRLGLVSVREQDAATGLLVPAWDFLGYKTSEINGKETIINTNGQSSFLTINAVDGSIISRANGY